jgi:hypothetical protein
MQLDLSVADEDDCWIWMKVHRLLFEVDGQEAPAGYRARLPDTRSTSRWSRSTESRSGPLPR